MGVIGFKCEERCGCFIFKNFLENNLERKFSYLVLNYYEKILVCIVVNFLVWINDKIVKIKGVSVVVIFYCF